MNMLPNPIAGAGTNPKVFVFRRLVVRLMIAFLGLILVWIAVRHGASALSAHRATPQTDLLGYYSAARLMREGHGGSLYDLSALQQAERAAVAPLRMSDPVLPYLAPPYFAVAFIPAATLPYSLTYALWLICNVVMLGTVIYFLERFARIPTRNAPIVWVALLAFVPTVFALAQGQVSILILALLTAYFFALRGGREALAGILLALALIKPPFVVPFLLVLVARGSWRALGAFAAATLALFVAPALILGAQINSDYLSILGSVTKAQGRSDAMSFHHVQVAAATYDPHTNYSLAAFVQLLTARPLASVIIGSASVIILLSLFFVGRASSNLDQSFALAGITAILVNPHVLVHDLVLILLPMAIALRYRHRRLTLLLLLLATTWVLINVGGEIAVLTRVQVGVVAVAALGFWLIRYAWDPFTPKQHYWQDARVSEGRLD